MGQPVLITDADDPRLSPFRSMRDPVRVAGAGLFVIEGETVLRRAVGAARPLVSVLVAERKRERLADLFQALAPEVEVMTAPQPVMDAVAGFAIHRGVLALGRRTPDTAPEALSTARLVLGLMGVADPDNVGALFRNAAAFGADMVVLDHACADPLYRKAIRTSAAASLIVPSIRLARSADMLEVFAAHGLTTLAMTPAGPERLSEVAPPPRTALLMGAEGPGLPADVIARARGVAIPMAGGFDSLNVAVAAAVALHHLRFGAGASALAAPNRAP